jgi:glycosyltransferase involved in cell wall biosynthesis
MTLEQAGWRVVVCGFSEPEKCPLGWQFVRLPSDFPYGRFMTRALGLLRISGRALARWAPSASLRQIGARLYNQSVPEYHWIGKSLARFLRANSALRPNLVVSHDYYTADVGAQLAALAGAKFIVDCHEYARGQYMTDHRWVRTQQPIVQGLQDFFLARADAVTTVCGGIARLLDAEQVLRRPVTVVRSVPALQVQPFRPVGERIVVLYHGVISPVRGLHLAVASMRFWRPEFELLLRGNVDPSYKAELLAIAKSHGVTHRLKFDAPVAFDQIVSAANSADIGYFVHEESGPQKRFVLPNKFFEYVMAGLALCVSDLPEMATIVNHNALGQLVPQFDEAAIAAAINGFDREVIDRMKRNSLAAAQNLNWEAEQQIMVDLYNEVMA